MATLSLRETGATFQVCAQALKAHARSTAENIHLILDISRNPIGVEGTISLMEDCIKCSAVKSLILSSCSVGRFLDPETGAFVQTTRACCSVGLHGFQLVSLDLSWNDLTPDAMSELVRGLLAITLPDFDAESFDPCQLTPTRSCALQCLELRGNSICDRGLAWILLLLASMPTGEPTSSLTSLGLAQCALEAEGGAALAHALSGSSSALRSLDVRETDLVEATRPLAEAVAASTSIVSFCGIDLANVRVSCTSALSFVSDDGISVIVAGKDSMAHGVLALLLTLRPFLRRGLVAHVDASRASPHVTVAELTLDLKSSAMCGFYWERTEVFDELMSMLDVTPKPAASAVNPQSAPVEGTISGVDTSEVELGGIDSLGVGSVDAEGPSLVLKRIDLDTATGLTPRQLRQLYDASKLNPGAEIILDGVPFAPTWACSVQ
jgi:hypothetical protein